MIYNSHIARVTLLPANYHRNQFSTLQKQILEKIQTITGGLKLKN